MKEKILLFVIIITLSHVSLAQIILIPITKEANNKLAQSASRTKDIDPIKLPFWDDFSTSRNGYADDKRWQFGKSVWINPDMAINPPTFNVATFDGLDSLGKPYNVNDVLAKGLADKLVSAPIRMDLVPESDRTRIFITFFYQFHGNGEPPDVGDLLSLSFKNKSGGWEIVWSKENNGTLPKDKFEQVTIPITAEKFFFDNFQFRFQNFARLSGPYDTWHLDYIYISNGKIQTAPVRPLFPDRAIAAPLTSPFSDYNAVPIKHFFSNISANTKKSGLILTNQRQDQVAGNGQPISYNSFGRIAIKKGELPLTIMEFQLDNNVNIGSELIYNQHKEVLLNTLPDFSALDPKADSINIKLKAIFDTGDNKIKSPTEGDYDLSVFDPIDFRSNDSISGSFILSNYYAYDDGTAEYGAGLNQPGAQLAYEFNMKKDTTDYIVALDIYFPRFGDESNQVIQLQVLQAVSNSPSDVIYQVSLPIQRNTQNKFWRIPIVDTPIKVKGKFYVGWKQNSTAVIAVGLDKNSDSGNKIYANLNGTWEKNTTLKGNLMIRPVFGKGAGGEEVTGVEKSNLTVYPNPVTDGSFFISDEYNQVEVYSLQGQRIETIKEYSEDHIKITLSNSVPGLYVIKVVNQNQVIAQKILVK